MMTEPIHVIVRRINELRQEGGDLVAEKIRAEFPEYSSLVIRVAFAYADATSCTIQGEHV
jgi:hypothetical protein